MPEEIMIISKAGVGCYDRNYPMLFFDVAGEGYGAFLCFSMEEPEFKTILSTVRDVRDLDGRACVVERVNGYIDFKKLLPAAGHLR